jgi:hypothetical protein
MTLPLIWRLKITSLTEEIDIKRPTSRKGEWTCLKNIDNP